MGWVGLNSTIMARHSEWRLGIEFWALAFSKYWDVPSQSLIRLENYVVEVILGSWKASMFFELIHKLLIIQIYFPIYLSISIHAQIHAFNSQVLPILIYLRKRLLSSNFIHSSITTPGPSCVSKPRRPMNQGGGTTIHGPKARPGKCWLQLWAEPLCTAESQATKRTGKL